MSPNIAVRTTSTQKAFEFYTQVLGFKHRPEHKEYIDLDADPLNLFVIEDDELNGPVMELFVDDIEKAKLKLIEHGCTVIRWEGKGHDCYIKDPFGITFNLWETETIS